MSIFVWALPKLRCHLYTHTCPLGTLQLPEKLRSPKPEAHQHARSLSISPSTKVTTDFRWSECARVSCYRRGKGLEKSVCSISIHRLPAISKFFSNLQLLDVGTNHQRGSPHAYPPCKPPSQTLHVQPLRSTVSSSLFIYSCVYLLFHCLRLSRREEASSRENSHQFIKAFPSVFLPPLQSFCLYLCLKGPTSTQTSCHSSVAPLFLLPHLFPPSFYSFHSLFVYWYNERLSCVEKKTQAKESSSKE